MNFLLANTIHMMYGYGEGWGMMGGSGGFLAPLFAIVVLADLILVGIWLWQQITKR